MASVMGPIFDTFAEAPELGSLGPIFDGNASFPPTFSNGPVNYFMVIGTGSNLGPSMEIENISVPFASSPAAEVYATLSFAAANSPGVAAEQVIDLLLPSTPAVEAFQTVEFLNARSPAVEATTNIDFNWANTPGSVEEATVEFGLANAPGVEATTNIDFGLANSPTAAADLSLAFVPVASDGPVFDLFVEDEVEGVLGPPFDHLVAIITAFPANGPVWDHDVEVIPPPFTPLNPATAFPQETMIQHKRRLDITGNGAWEWPPEGGGPGVSGVEDLREPS